MPDTNPVNPDEPTPSPVPTPPPDEPPKPPTTGSGLKDTIAVAVACFALTGFSVFIIALLYLLDLPEVRWSRAVFLLTAVEAVAFAAAGYLFGREVNRGRAENAEELANSEAKRANQIEKNGQALAEGVRTMTRRTRFRKESVDKFESEAPQLELLVRMADTLFPPRGTEDWR